MRFLQKLETYTGPLMIVLFALAVGEQFAASVHWGHNSWCMTEWLINYSGGFVRRGLPGQIVYSLSGITGIPGHLLAIAASLLLLLALMFFFWKKSEGRIPALLIYSPIVLGGAAYQEFLIRKDTLCIVLLILCLLVDRTKWAWVIRTSLVNLLGVAAILTHEGFVFYGLPAIVMCRYLSGGKSLLRSGIAFSPMIVAFVIASIFHGSAATATAINDSLIDLWARIDPSDAGIRGSSCAIDSLKYSLTNCPWMGYSVLWEISYGIYTPIAWLWTILICVIYLLEFTRPSTRLASAGMTSSDEEKNRLFVILVFQLATIFPLFMIGWDYGRWIFLWSTSSVAIYLLGLDWRRPLLVAATRHSGRILQKIRLPWTPRRWHLLVFGIPGCSWSIFRYLQATPIGHQVDFICQTFLHKNIFTL